jgi:CBS domain-containing protein
MAEAKVRALVVIDEHCELAGILSQTDLVNATLAHRDAAYRDMVHRDPAHREAPRWQETMVCEAMTQDVLTVTPDTPLSEAAKILVDNNVHRLVVIDRQRSECSPVGVLSVGDIMRRLTGEQ